jgi:hypothetical protein
VHAFLHGFRQLLLVVRQERFDFMVRFIANGVDLRTESFTRERRILIEQGLNLVVVLQEQRPDLFPLVRRKFQILGQMIEFLVDRPWGPMECRTRSLRRRIILGDGNRCDGEREHAIECEVQKASHSQISSRR